MAYLNSTSGRYSSATPDMVYDQMMAHVSLLREGATKSPFFLPWIFHGALTVELQSMMQKAKFTIPSPQTLPIKSKQISSMTSCRDFSRDEFQKMKETGRHIE